MFNLFLRPYVPGFRVKAQKDVPGFNIGENDGAPLTPPIVSHLFHIGFGRLDAIGSADRLCRRRTPR
jgi:hypothetical protein